MNNTSWRRQPRDKYGKWTSGSKSLARPYGATRPVTREVAASYPGPGDGTSKYPIPAGLS